MTLLDWILLGVNAIAYALGHYHGNSKGLATAANVLSQFKPQDSPASVTGPDDVDAAAQRAGIVAGAAAYEASKRAGPHGT